MFSIKRKIYFIILLYTFIPFFSWAQNTNICSSNGYTVLTINGIFNDELDARANKRTLEDKLVKNLNSQPVVVDFLYNPSHFAGLQDLLDAVGQKYFEEKTINDYDIKKILSDASQKVKTQKLLLVAHSQGNFYSNSFYNIVADKEGGVPRSSIGMYGVATPASYVAGGGEYITSSTDQVINKIRFSNLLSVLPSNVNIDISKSRGSNGHSFSDDYLNYEGARIISEIKSSLGKLKNNNIQKTNEPCISTPKLDLTYKVVKVFYNIVDPVSSQIKTAVDTSYKVGSNIAEASYKVGSFIGSNIRKIGMSVNNMFANAIDTLPDTSVLTTLTPEVLKQDNVEENQKIEEVITPTEDTIGSEEIKQEEQVIETPAVVVPPVVETPVAVPPIYGGSFGGGGGFSSTSEPEPEAEVITEAEPEPEAVIEPEPESEIIVEPESEVVAEPEPEPESEEIPAPIPDTTPPVITLNGDSAQYITKNSVYTDLGATALDDVDGVVSVTTEGSVNTSSIGSYTITYTVTDSSSNISTKTRQVYVSSFVYVPQYTFGRENGDGNDWQAWFFNGSYIYDWTDTYVDNYLREQFKLQASSNSALYCSSCLQRGVFKKNPLEGFEISDLSVSALEGVSQNNGTGNTYNVVLQWDSTGYTYTISHDDIIDFTGHTTIPNLTNAAWVGWDDSYNNFRNFPSGVWASDTNSSPLHRTGGYSMMMAPFPIYQEDSEISGSFLSFPNQGGHAGVGINATRGRNNFTPFSFQTIFSDSSNTAPQNITLHVGNENENSFTDIVMQKETSMGGDFNDNNFVNGELYSTDDNVFPTGDYAYYFTATDNRGNVIRLPSEGYLYFQTIPFTYTYIPIYSFGTDNGDGNDWQAWAFNGSTVFDWSDTYINQYLLERFKIKTFNGLYCSQCIQRGIFNHDPQKGFESTDFTKSYLESSPQNMMDNLIYDVSMQWDATGYTYTVTQGDTIYGTGHTEVSNIDENTWVGWNGAQNGFTRFPAGTSYAPGHSSLLGLFGGADMIMKPFKVFDSTLTVIDPEPEPEPEPELEPTPDTTSPSISVHTFDGNTGDITINPLNDALEIAMTASENVDWVSVKIEREADDSFYKMFFSNSSTCVDNTNTCTRTWDGTLSSGGLLEAGVYRIRVRIEDASGNKNYEPTEYYLPSVINVVTGG